jgi:RimJ/RimL family protein N-acetyltransferase
MKLHGDRVKLRPFKNSDFDDLYRWWNDPKFSGDYGFSPLSKSELKKNVTTGSYFIIEIRAGDSFGQRSKKIGFIEYYLVRSDYAYLYEIGYGIIPSERRKGYTTEAARLLLDYLFATKKKIERIESVTDVENVPSQRVLEKNGFKREAELRKRYFDNGQYRNEYMYSLLREEWQTMKANASSKTHHSKS